MARCAEGFGPQWPQAERALADRPARRAGRWGFESLKARWQGERSRPPAGPLSAGSMGRAPLFTFKEPKPLGPAVVQASAASDPGSVLDREVLVGLRASAWVLATLYLLFTMTHQAFLQAGAREVMVPLTFAEMVAILLLLGMWSIWPPSPAAAHRWILVLGGLALLNSGALLALTGEPKQATNLYFLAIGGGFLLLRRAYFAAYTAAVVAVFVAVAADAPSPEWTHYVFGMLSAVALAVVLHVVHRATTLRLDRARQLAQERERHLRTILTGAPLALFAVDAKGTFTLAEGRGMASVGLKTEDLVGRSAFEAFAGHPNLPALREVLAGKRTRITAEQGGRLFDVEFTPLPDGGAVGVATDVTDRRLAEQARRAAESEADEANRLRELDHLRTSFVNVAAHELNTPLTPIRMQLALLGNEDPARRARALAILRRNVDRLSRIVRDLVTVNRLQQGRLDMRPGPTDLAEVVRQGVESFRDAAATGGIDLRHDVKRAVSLVADADRLQQVVDNLLANAVKFTQRGGAVEVRLRHAKGLARVEVQDDGPGIAAEDLSRLFRPFSQLEAGRERGGTGLGLHLSREIVEAHGGRIWAESPGPGLGSTFVVELPMAGRGSGA